MNTDRNISCCFWNILSNLAGIVPANGPPICCINLVGSMLTGTAKRKHAVLICALNCLLVVSVSGFRIWVAIMVDHVLTSRDVLSKSRMYVIPFKLHRKELSFSSKWEAYSDRERDCQSVSSKIGTVSVMRFCWSN